MFTNRNSVASQLAIDQISTRQRRLVYYPKADYYFQPTTSNTNEMDLNATQFYDSIAHIYHRNNVPNNLIRGEFLALTLSHKIYSSRTRLMVNPDGGAGPAYLPLLEDLAENLQNGVPTLVKWFYRNHLSSTDVVPRDLVPIMNMKPNINPDTVPMYTLPTRINHIFVGPYTDTLYLMEVNQTVTKVELDVCLFNTYKGRRYYFIAISSGRDVLVGDKLMVPRGSVLLCWNARNISRPSFLEHFRVLFRKHAPIVFVIIESRISKEMMKEVRVFLPGAYNCEVFGPQIGGPGGVVIILTTFDVYPKFGFKGYFAEGKQVTVTFRSLYQPGARRRLPIPATAPPLPVYEDDFQEQVYYVLIDAT